MRMVHRVLLIGSIFLGVACAERCLGIRVLFSESSCEGSFNCSLRNPFFRNLRLRLKRKAEPLPDLPPTVACLHGAGALVLDENNALLFLGSPTSTCSPPSPCALLFSPF